MTHPDLKPANILQRPTGEMMLIDFGLARRDELPDLLAEEFAISLGTYRCITPEQFLRQRVDYLGLVSSKVVAAAAAAAFVPVIRVLGG